VGELFMQHMNNSTRPVRRGLVWWSRAEWRLPSGHFHANGNWTVLAALAHNLLR
jgi:hypothetical protein